METVATSSGCLSPYATLVERRAQRSFSPARSPPPSSTLPSPPPPPSAHLGMVFLVLWLPFPTWILGIPSLHLFTLATKQTCSKTTKPVNYDHTSLSSTPPHTPTSSVGLKQSRARVRHNSSSQHSASPHMAAVTVCVCACACVCVCVCVCGDCFGSVYKRHPIRGK